MFVKTSGNGSVHMIGDVNIATGANAAATMDTVFQTLVSTPISAADTGSVCTTFRS